jgi:hypothetical protein
VFEGPNDRVQDELELGGRDGEEGIKTVQVDGLEEDEKVCPMFRKFLEILKLEYF